MYEFFSNFYPKKMRDKYMRLLRYSQMPFRPERFLGFVLSFGFGVSLAFSLMFAKIFNIPLVLLFGASFFAAEFLVYFFLLMRSDAKARVVETVLPDALQLMASNLRAGLTIDKALLLSARPEFGPLQDEINNIGKEVTMGKELEDALLEMKERIRSERLEKTILLIVAGLKSGGQLARLLEQTARNLREQAFVDEKIRSNVMMYVIFVFVAVGIGAPFLFGLSSFLVEVLTSVLSSVTMPDVSVASAMPMSFSQVNISVDFVINYAITFLVVTSIMGSMIIGLISKGKETEGAKFVPVLIALTLGLFFLVRFGMRTLLGGLFNL